VLPYDWRANLLGAPRFGKAMLLEHTVSTNIVIRVRSKPMDTKEVLLMPLLPAT
jgi:hypothetical protein